MGKYFFSSDKLEIKHADIPLETRPGRKVQDKVTGEMIEGRTKSTKDLAREDYRKKHDSIDWSK